MHDVTRNAAKPKTPAEVITIRCPDFGKMPRFFTFNHNLITIDRIDDCRCEVKTASEIGISELKTLAKLITFANKLYAVMHELPDDPDDDRVEQFELPF
jgi:hypothetical protein